MQLLESSAPRRRARGGTAVSVLVHVTLIGAAMAATANARLSHDRHEPRERAVFYAPPPPPAAPAPAHATRADPSRSPSPVGLPPVPPIPVVGPVIDAPAPAEPAIDPLRGLGDTFERGLRSGAESGGAPSGAPSGDAPREAAWVDRVAVPLGQLHPRYPASLRAQGLGGRVVVRFVVDTLGRVESRTVQVVGASHPAFADAALQALPALRFRPAEAGGRRVRQLVELPFEFVIQ